MAMAVARSADRLTGTALRKLVIAFAVLIGVQAVAAVLIVTKVRAAEHTEADRQAVLTAAKQQVVNMITIDYRRVDQDIQRIGRGLTGSLRDDFGAKQAPRLAETVRKAQTVSQGTALSAGIVSIDEDSAEVVVAANSTVQSLRPEAAEAAAEGKATTAQRLWRATLEMRRQGDDRWLAEKLELEVVG